MKSNKLFIFAIMIFAAIAAQTNTASAQKKNASRNWMVFNTYQTVTEERSANAAKFSCQSAGVYATAKFAMPVDLSDGFYVTLATAGEVIIQHKMTVEVAPQQIRSIMVDLVPDTDADLGFPDATLDYSRKLLTELNPGVYKIMVAVSVGKGDDEQIAAGEFTFDNRRGCEERFARVDRLINGEVTGDVETDGNEEKPANDDTDIPDVPTRPQPDKPQVNATNYVEFVNNCAEDRYVSYQYPNGTFSTFPVQKNFPRRSDYPVGTKFWNGNTMDGDPFYVLPASQYTGEMDKARNLESIVICQ